MVNLHSHPEYEIYGLKPILRLRFTTATIYYGYDLPGASKTRPQANCHTRFAGKNFGFGCGYAAMGYYRAAASRLI